MGPNFLYYFAAAMLGHFVGDYLFQNQWMATRKSLKGMPGHIACTIHILLYIFAVALFVGWHPLFLLVVAAPHWIIDRWSLANYWLWLKNGYHPKNTWNTSPLCAAGASRSGYLAIGSTGEAPSAIAGGLITIPVVEAVANNSADLQNNVWRLAFAAPIYIFNDNTLHWVCLWFTCKHLLR